MDITGLAPSTSYKIARAMESTKTSRMSSSQVFHISFSQFVALIPSVGASSSPTHIPSEIPTKAIAKLVRHQQDYLGDYHLLHRLALQLDRPFHLSCPYITTNFE